MKSWTNAELIALPERSTLIRRETVTTDPHTGHTTRTYQPQRFVPNDSEIVTFRDRTGQRWIIGRDGGGYCKTRYGG